MSFLNPIVFWGLLSLLIPLIIHLLSKREQETIYFGSNKFLEDTETTSARSFQLSDFLLLLTRLLLLAGLVLALAQFAKEDNSISKVNYLEYSLKESGDYNSLLSSFEKGIPTKYFSYDKTLVNDSVAYFPSAYTLIHHLNQSSDSVKVYTSSQSRNFIGAQVIPKENISWQVIPIKENQPADATDNSSMNVEILYASQSERHKSELLSVIGLVKEYLPFEINFQSSKEWQIHIDTTVNDVTDHKLIWQTDSNEFSFDEVTANYKMRGPLSKKSMLSADFPLRLTQMLINSRVTDRSREFDVFDPTILVGNKDVEILKAESPKRFTSFSKYFWLVVVFLVMIERYLSLRASNK